MFVSFNFSLDSEKIRNFLYIDKKISNLLCCRNKLAKMEMIYAF
jgi:hypothetical protein